MPKSTNRYQDSPGIPTLLILITTLTLASAQSECAARAFPSAIPMRPNETLLINLQHYFEGSNISYAVTPNNQQSRIDATFECQEQASQNSGKIVASYLLQQYGLQIHSNLIDAGANTYFLSYLLTNSFKITSLQPPKQKYTNCSALVMRLLTATSLEVVIHCIHTQLESTSVLVSTTTSIYSTDPKWSFITVPLFANDYIGSPQLFFYGDSLLRGIASPTNSYVEIWHWEQEVRELIGVADRTLLYLSVFNLKWMQLHNSALVVLDFNTGMHVLRIGNQRKITWAGSISEPYFQIFTYVPASGMLYLAKKGKVVSAVLKSLESKIVTGSSFNLYTYESVRKIVVSEEKLVILGQTQISVFSLQDQSSYRHSNIYNSRGTSQFFQLNRPNQPLTLILAKQQRGIIRYYTCSIRSPLLRLITPSSTVVVKVMGYSVIAGDISTCLQNFMVYRLTTEQDLIYNNGYEADSQVLFANLPGSGVVELAKYGAGKNMTYKVTKDPQSKLEYTATVRKDESQQCSIQNRPIPIGGKIYFTRTWENILITQLTSDYSLKYFICRTEGGPSCSYAVEIPSMKPVEFSAYELIDSTGTYSISYQALLQETSTDINILVRKIIVLKVAGQLQISGFCTIKISNFVKEYANVTQLEIKNGRLFVLMPYRKEVRIYNLVDGTCPLLLSLTASNFPDAYFAPRSLHFDQNTLIERQQLFYIRQWDELLTLRIKDTSLAVDLVGRNQLPEVWEGQLVISRPYLIYLSETVSKALVYRQDDSNKYNYLRELPLEGLQFSTVSGKRNFFSVLDGTHLSLRLINTTTKLQIVKIFAIDELISAAVEYASFIMAKEDQAVTFLAPANAPNKQLILLQLLPGPSTDFLICKSYNVYLQPSVYFSFNSVRSTTDTYSENVTLQLATADDRASHKFKISLYNLGQAITRGAGFPRKGTEFQAATELLIDDRNWFIGNVYSFDFDCSNCNDRVQFKQKITVEMQSELPLSSFTTKKFFLRNGEQSIEAVNGPFLVQMQYNHTAWPLQEESTTYGLSQTVVLSVGAEQCIDTILIPEKNMIIALCYHLNAENVKQYMLSVVSTVSMSYFVISQSRIDIEDIAWLKLHYKDDLIVVYSTKVAILLTMWEIEGSLELLELDVIDKEDISGDICTVELISNSTSPVTPITSILYGLFVTQCSSSLYYTSFSIYLNMQEPSEAQSSIPNIHVSYSQNINLLKGLSQKRIQIPTEARIIQTITKQQDFFSQIEESFSFLIIFDRFHSYSFRLITSKVGRIIKTITLTSIFYKFGANVAVSAQLQTYLVLKYVLDLGYGKLEQLYGCFDFDRYTTNKDQVKEYYSFAAYTFKKFQGLSTAQEDFPWVLKDHRIFHIHLSKFELLSLNSSLVANISGLGNSTEQLYTQSVIITANNPISARSASIILRSVDKFELSGIEIALIVIGGIVVLIALIVGGRILARKIRKKLKQVPLSQKMEVEDADLEQQEEERAAEWLINKSQRGSMEP